MPQGLRRARSARGSFAQTETLRYSPQTLSIYSLNVPFAIAVSLYTFLSINPHPGPSAAEPLSAYQQQQMR